MIKLNTVYKDKDDVKSKGALWNSELKVWQVSKRSDYSKFIDYLNVTSNHLIICNNIYLIEGFQRCFVCQKSTKIILFGFDDYMYLKDGKLIRSRNQLKLIAHLNPMPKTLLRYAQKQSNFRKTYSKAIKGNKLGNKCMVCGTLQGIRYSVYNKDGVFNPDNLGKDVVFTKIPLSEDIITTKEEIINTKNLNNLLKNSKMLSPNNNFKL